jgi:hypothetical protein
MTTLTQFQKHFSTTFRTTNNKKPARHILVMKFKSGITLFELKSQIFEEKYITATNIYMREHTFKYIMDITSPGWLFGKHPQNHHKDNIKLEMLTDIGRACPNQDIPFFHLDCCSPNWKDKNGRLYQTHALCIHVDRNKKKILEKLLKATYKSKKPLFVAWSWKKDQPMVFCNAMIAQATFLTSCWVVPVHGISETQMTTLRPLLLTNPSVSSIECTKYTNDTGRWDILVDRIHFRAAQVAVHSIFETFKNSTPSAAAKLPTLITKNFRTTHIRATFCPDCKKNN